MNEFGQKKIGEVIAFSRIGIELMERGGDAAVEALGGNNYANDFNESMTAYRDTLESDATEITTVKADKTTDKLREMMERYIGDEWDNHVELMEWLGFYTGAAVVHWALVIGVAEQNNDDTLASIAEQAVDKFQTVLESVKEQLHEHGSSN